MHIIIIRGHYSYARIILIGVIYMFVIGKKKMLTAFRLFTLCLYLVINFSARVCLAKEICIVNSISWEKSEVLSTLNQNYNTQAVLQQLKHNVVTLTYEEAQIEKNTAATLNRRVKFF